MARNLYIDQQDGTIEDIRFKSNENIDKESQKKLLDLALHKINHRL